MIKTTLFVASIFLLSPLAFGQELDVDVTEFCQDEEYKCLAPESPLKADKVLLDFFTNTDAADSEKKKTCEAIMSLAESKAPPVELKVDDDEGNKWKIRFHFGFTRTNIRPADVKIESSLVNTEIKGFQFDERTSANHYNPKNWKELQDGFRWIDEPSNTFTFSIENKKNAIYLTAFHPKFLKTYHEIKDGDQTTYVPVNDPTKYLSEGTDKSYSAIPDGQAGVEIQNTHMLMNYSLGYGRKFNIMDNKSGKITNIVRVDAGVMVGAARSIYIEKNVGWNQTRDRMRLQGVNGSIGDRLEYQKGKVGAFVEWKYSKMGPQEYRFLDGTAKSKGGDFSTINFGVSVDVLDPNRNEEKKEKKEMRKMKKEEKKLNELDKIELAH